MDAHFAVSLQSQTLRCISAPSMAGSDQQWQEVVGVALTGYPAEPYLDGRARLDPRGDRARAVSHVALRDLTDRMPRTDAVGCHRSLNHKRKPTHIGDELLLSTLSHPLCQRSCPPLYFSSIFQVGGIGR